MKTVLIAVLSCVALVAVQARASVYDELTPEQKTVVQNGQQVTLLQDVSGSPWPQVTVYQRAEASPEEVAGMFFDYESATKYVPDLTKARVLRWLSKTVAEIEYEMDLPWPLPNSTYSTTTVLSQAGEAYHFIWKMIRSNSMKDMSGHAVFEPLGTGTILRYVAFINPDSSMAGMFRNKAIKSVKDGSNAVVKRVEAMRVKEPALLQKYIERLRAALR